MEFNKENLFLLHAGCKIVKGHIRSIIYDLNRFDYHFIPNALADILLEFEGSNFNNIANAYDVSDKPIILEYFEFLIDKEIIFFPVASVEKCFMPLPQAWNYAAHITNCIIEDEGNHDWTALFSIFKTLLCRYIRVKFSSTRGFNHFAQMLKSDSILAGVDIIIRYDEEFSKDNMALLFKENPIIIKYCIFDSPFQEVLNSGCSVAVAVYSKLSIQELNKPAVVSLQSFAVDMLQYVEAQKHNIYFNRKLYFDKSGNIKSGEYSDEIFGNIYIDNILKIYNKHSLLKQFWERSRDETEKCCICEFRYMCLFSAEPMLKEIGEGYYLSQDCGYNPYKAVFENTF